MFQELVNRYHEFFQKFPLKFLGISAILIAIGLLILRGCDKHEIQKINQQSLQGNEKTAVIINSNTGTVTTIDSRSENRQLSKSSNSLDASKQIISRFTGARDIRVSVDSKGKVTVTARTKGFCLDVGPVIGYKRIGFDVQCYFWRNLGPTFGVATDFHGRDFRLYGGLSYTLPWALANNCGVVLTYDTSKQVNLLFKIKLGRN